MKILMISLDPYITNPSSYSYFRMKEYGALDRVDELHIISLTGQDYKKIKKTQEDNIFVYSAKGFWKLLFIVLFPAFFIAKKIGDNILKNNQEDLIITAQDPFITGYLAYRLAKKYKLKFEIQLHGDFYGNRYWKKEKFIINNILWHLGKYIIKRANLVRVVSERVKKSIEKLNENIYKAPIYFDKKEMDLRMQMAFGGDDAKSGANILSVGNLVPVKNHKLLINTFAEIKKDISNTKLIILGDDFLKNSLQSLAKNLGLKIGEDIFFPGHYGSLEDFYKWADIFVHPSLYEGWGRVVVEAASFSLPIIMTDVGLAGEIIKNNESGVVIIVNDKDALKMAILDLVNNQDKRKRLGEAAKKAVEALPKKEEILQLIKNHWLKLVI